MPRQQAQLTPLGNAPRRKAVTLAWRYLRGTHETVTGLFDSFDIVREEIKTRSGKDPRGRLSHDEQNLLRAALVFTSAGLDATLRQLLRDSLDPMLNHSVAAEKAFKAQLDKWTRDPANGGEPTTIKKAVIDSDPRGFLIKRYQEVLSTASIQQTGQLKTVRDALGLPKTKITDAKIDALGPFFADRNQISHELDYVSGGTKRTSRSVSDTSTQCDKVLQLVQSFVLETAAALPSPKSKGRP